VSYLLLLQGLFVSLCWWVFSVVFDVEVSPWLSQFRKLTKTKGAFTNENSSLKLLYAGILNAAEKQTMPIHNWSLS